MMGFQRFLGESGQRGVQLARWRGIDIRLDWSWFLIGFLCLLNFSSYLHGLGLGGGIAFLGAAVATGLFLATVLLHEMGHAAVAQRYGIRTHSIVLHLIGGVAKLEREARRPGEEVAIAAAGPLVNLTLALFLTPLAYLMPGDGTSLLRALGIVFGWAAAANLLLGALNLLPAFPLDGGRILRGFLWQHHGSRPQGTLQGVKVSRICAYACLVVGAAILVSTGDSFLALSLALMAWIIFQGTRAEELQALATQQGGGFSPFPGMPFGHFKSPQPRKPKRRVIRTIRYPDGRVIEIFEE